MSQQRVRIGVIGAGANTRLRHIPGFQALPGVEVVVVANRSRASAEKVAQEFGIPRVAEDWRSVIADPEVDAVCIGTWPNMHAPCTLAALAAGKHVLCEARLARDHAEAQSMLKAAQDRPHLVAQVVPSPFTLEVDATVQALIADGRLGKLLTVEIVHETGLFLDPEAPLSWRQSSQLSGCNMLTLGIFHEVIQRWFPEEMAESVSAVGTVVTKERLDPQTGRPVTVELPDILTVAGRLAGGAHLLYHFSAVASGERRWFIRLQGSLATLRVDLPKGALYLSPTHSTELVPVPVEEGTRRGWQVESDFIRSIREQRPVRLTTFAEGERYMRFTEAVYRSVRQGGTRVMV